MLAFHHPTIDLHIDQHSGFFSLLNGMQVTDCQPWVCGQHEDGQPFAFAIRLDVRASASQMDRPGWEKLIFEGSDAASGLDWQVRFYLPSDRHMLSWDITLTNQSQLPRCIHQVGLLQPARANEGNLPSVKGAPPHELSVFCNGWQSWSYSAAYRGDERMRRSRLGLLHEPMVLNPDTPLPRRAGAFGSDFFTILGNTRQRSGLLLGFLSQKQHFGSLAIDLRAAARVRMWANGDGARLDAGQSVSTDMAAAFPLMLDEADAMGAYIRAVAEENGIGELPSAPAGWCSWYQYYQNISADIIRANLDKMVGLKEQMPLELLQIDDGFQAQVGDWLRFAAGFPNGVMELANEIKEKGFTPGLWLAPFILHPASQTARQHPGWLLRDRRGRRVRAGFGWNALTVALDLTVPEALDYASHVVSTAARAWGCPYLKLDFLYAAALKGCYRDRTRTRAQVMRAGMRSLRQAAGEGTFLLGCGAPLGSMLGLAQGMRIGADVSASWQPSFHGVAWPFRDEPHMPAARNAIQNVLTRAALHGRWWVNDPDCLLVRPDARLSLAEMRSLATVITLSGGSLLLSDDLTKLTPERRRLAACLLPLIGERARVLDWMDSQTPARLRLDLDGPAGHWTLAAAFNWSHQDQEYRLTPQDFELPDQVDYRVRSFWDGRVSCAKAGQPLYCGRLPAHGVVLLALRLADMDNPAYLGSDLHISQGREVAEWMCQPGSVSLALDIGRREVGAVDLYLPHPLRQAEQDGTPVGFEPIGEGCWRISVNLHKRARLRLTG